MSLRKDWSGIKDAALMLFKNATGGAQLKALAKNEDPPAYPLKFKEDLGPTLDKYEGAKKPEDKKKYGDAAKLIIKSYKQAINKEKKTLDSADPKIVQLLTHVLDQIDGKIK